MTEPNLVDRLGIATEMKPKMRPMPAEYNVEVVARGEVDLVVAAASSAMRRQQLE